MAQATDEELKAMDEEQIVNHIEKPFQELEDRFLTVIQQKDTNDIRKLVTAYRLYKNKMSRDDMELALWARYFGDASPSTLNLYQSQKELETTLFATVPVYKKPPPPPPKNPRAKAICDAIAAYLAGPGGDTVDWTFGKKDESRPPSGWHTPYILYTAFLRVSDSDPATVQNRGPIYPFSVHFHRKPKADKIRFDAKALTDCDESYNKAAINKARTVIKDTYSNTAFGKKGKDSIGKSYKDSHAEAEYYDMYDIDNYNQNFGYAQFDDIYNNPDLGLYGPYDGLNKYDLYQNNNNHDQVLLSSLSILLIGIICLVLFCVSFICCCLGGYFIGTASNKPTKTYRRVVQNVKSEMEDP